MHARLGALPDSLTDGLLALSHFSQLLFGDAILAYCWSGVAPWSRASAAVSGSSGNRRAAMATAVAAGGSASISDTGRMVRDA
jgi:hypothetical protein